MADLTEYQKARAWREAKGWTQEELGSYLGYSRETIYWMENGRRPSGDAIDPMVWHRYKLCCGALESHVQGQSKFNWGQP